MIQTNLLEGTSIIRSLKKTMKNEFIGSITKASNHLLSRPISEMQQISATASVSPSEQNIFEKIVACMSSFQCDTSY